MSSRLVDLNLRPDPRALRRFGYGALVGFGLLALLAWREAGMFAFGLGEARLPLAAAFAALGAISILFSFAAPRANLPLYLTLTLVTFPIGFVMSYVILGVLFFVVFGGVALIMRLLRRDPLHRAYDPSAKSYWSEARHNRSNESYFRQF
jgi:hypothetical protein